MTHETKQQPVTPSDRSYEVYDSLLVSAGSPHPQMQGLGPDEFPRVVDDPETVCTTVITAEGERFAMPQLTSVNANFWLNTDFFEQVFRDEMQSGDVRYFRDLGQVAAGSQVHAAVSALVESQGVLAFDYPTDDPEYPDRVARLVQESGAIVAGEEQLGTQTYYAGKCHLKRPEVAGERDPSIMVTFDRMLADGVLEPYTDNGASYHKLISKEEAEKLYETYEAAYKGINNHPCRQSVDADEFYHMLTEDSSIIKLVNRVDGEITTICLVTDNLEGCDWLDPRAYKEKFPVEHAENELIYFPAIYTDPEKRGHTYARQIIELLARMSEYGGHEVQVLFDNEDRNNGVLSLFLARFINKTPELEVDFQVIGTQQYMAYKLAQAPAA